MALTTEWESVEKLVPGDRFLDALRVEYTIATITDNGPHIDITTTGDRNLAYYRGTRLQRYTER